MEVTATFKTDGDKPDRVAAVNFDFGSDLDSSVKLFGAEVVYKRFVSAGVVDLQGMIRRNLAGDKPKTAKELQELADDWKPGIQRARQSKQEKALTALEELSNEDKLDFIKELQKSLRKAA